MAKEERSSQSTRTTRNQRFEIGGASEVVASGMAEANLRRKKSKTGLVGLWRSGIDSTTL